MPWFFLIYLSGDIEWLQFPFFPARSGLYPPARNEPSASKLELEPFHFRRGGWGEATPLATRITSLIIMWSKDKILSQEALLPLVAQWQQAGEQVVFTNGCFDLLHLGHVDYLEKARHLGHRLVVGLNTDASVSRLKPGRPLQDEVSRARVLASLLFVDAVTLFDEQTPLALIQAVRPNILVKGDDYQLSGIVGHEAVLENGGQVLTVPLVAGYSTTRIVERILSTAKT